MNTIGAFFRHTFLLFAHPLKTIRAVDADQRRVGFGILGAIFLTVVYLLVLGTGHFLRPEHMPNEHGLVLRIPAAQYYIYELFFLLPAGLGGAILAAGGIRLVAVLMHGKGSFERIFSLLSFGYVFVALVMGIPDLIADFWPTAPFFYVHVIIGTIGYFCISLLSVRHVEEQSWPKTIVLTLIGSVLIGLVQFMLIR